MSNPNTLFAYWNHTLLVEWASPCPLTRAFLSAYFVPWFDLVENGEAPPQAIRIVVHIGAPATPVDFSRATLQVIDASKDFLHTTGQFLPREDGLDVRIAPAGVFARVQHGRRLVTLWAPDDAALRIPMLRIIEDLVLDEVQRGGGVVLHASGVAAGGKVTLLVGNDGAGKTTGLLRLLSSFDVAQLATNQACLALRDGRLVVRGWPAFLSVSAATIATVPELAGDFPPQARLKLDEDDSLWSVQQKAALFPAQGAARFGARIEAEGELENLVFPAFRAHLAPHMSALSASQAVTSLPAFLQGVRNPNHRNWLGFEAVDEAAVLARLTQLSALLRAAEVGLYRLYWSPSIDELLARIPALRRRSKHLAACKNTAPPADGWPPLPGGPGL